MNATKIVLAYHAYMLKHMQGCSLEQYETARDQYDRVCKMYLGEV